MESPPNPFNESHEIEDPPAPYPKYLDPARLPQSELEPAGEGLDGDADNMQAAS